MSSPQDAFTETDYDYIVVGSGFTALAFIDETLRLDPKKKIICLERGDFILPSHFQSLKSTSLSGNSEPLEEFPWNLSEKTVQNPEIGFCHGSCIGFGGKSIFWAGWSPQPKPEQMRNYPEDMLITTMRPGFWSRAIEFLNVTYAFNNHDTGAAKLQEKISKILRSPITTIPSVLTSNPAGISLESCDTGSQGCFRKFSVPAPFLRIADTQRIKADIGQGALLNIILDCTVEILAGATDGHVDRIDTSRGSIAVTRNKTKVILCAGAIPNATLLLNSFKNVRETVGKRITGHFVSHVVARVPLDKFGFYPNEALSDRSNTLDIAIHHVAGQHPSTKRQYHIQITALHSTDPCRDAQIAASMSPGYDVGETFDRLKGSENYAIFACSTLGELTETNEDSWLRLDQKVKNLKTNVTLQYTMTLMDKQLWDFMDETTFQVVELLAGSHTPIEWWNKETQSWIKSRPATNNIRAPGIVHDSGTVRRVPRDHGGSVDELYRPYGWHNVFVTGNAILPTASSWNPTLTICGYAQDLARRLNAKEGDK